MDREAEHVIAHCATDQKNLLLLHCVIAPGRSSAHHVRMMTLARKPQTAHAAPAKAVAVRARVAVGMPVRVARAWRKPLLRSG
ncbi:hypothetical protein A167_00495 [Alcanivorax sp. S71-1-4]|nr:hypothetical protein A167_00495 [Alcanivorax sp. S71-1-4]